MPTVGEAVAIALTRLRDGLRAQVARSPLCDGNRFAASLSDLLRRVGRDRVRGARRPEERS